MHSELHSSNANRVMCERPRELQAEMLTQWSCLQNLFNCRFRAKLLMLRDHGGSLGTACRGIAGEAVCILQGDVS